MPEETITFELIRKIQREEQTLTKLTRLPDNFYQNANTYLQQKRKLLESREDKRTVLEMKNIERLLEDIFNRRERKILNQALITTRTNIKPENLTEEEKEFFDKLVSLLKERRSNMLDKLLSQEIDFSGFVIFKEDVPEFVGMDTKTYGPFKKGDAAKLPEENRKLMLDRGVAEEFKVQK